MLKTMPRGMTARDIERLETILVKIEVLQGRVPERRSYELNDAKNILLRIHAEELRLAEKRRGGGDV